MSDRNDIDGLFDALLKRHESNDLDFKKDGYDLSTADGQGDFVKDVICMANTPRSAPAYIVCGVDHTPEKGATPVGLSSQVDNAKWIDQLNESRVHPRPTIRYIPINRDGKQFAIIEIPVQTEFKRPFLPNKDWSKIKRGELWFRRDSKNSLADFDETMRIGTWFSGGTMTATEPRDSSGEWERFQKAVYRFESGRHFLLVADRVERANPESHAGIGAAPWVTVFDFDHESESCGLMASVRVKLEQNRSLQLVVKGQDPLIYPHGGTTWFFARGLAGRQSTLQLGPFKNWNNEYGKTLSNWVEAVAAALTPTPVTLVVLCNDLQLKGHLDKVLGQAAQSFGAELTIVVVSPDVDKYQDLCDKHDAVPIRLSPRAVSLGLADLFTAASASAGRFALPTRDEGIPYVLDRRDQLWLEEELEVVHLDIGLDGDQSPEEFARGAVVSWRNLQLRHDCDREMTDKLRQRIERELRDRNTARINLYHAAGAGGTTVARRVLWDLHTRYPCAVLHRFDALVTAERIGKMYALTSQSVLLLIDGAEHSRSAIDNLYDAVRSQQTPVVMLQVLRSFNPEAAPRRDFLLKSELTPTEADRFSHSYVRLVPTRKLALEARTKSSAGQERSAFYFGLEAFGRDFRGLQRFVDARIGEPGQPLRRLLGFLAIAHRYAQQPLPSQSFAALFQLPRDRRVDFRKALPPEVLELLVEESVDQWRPTHILISEEILRQVLCPQPEDRDRLWRQTLSAWAIEFAEFARGDSSVPSEQMLDVVRRAFVFRDNAELLGTERSAQQQFSQLVEDIPSSEGKLEVLRTLTEVYPGEAHFHAHLGRFCGLIRRFDEALAALDRAIRLNDRDSLLYHMRGMILRYKVNDLMVTDAPLGDVVALTKQASDCFAESRKLNPENEHGYISEVQLLIKVLDYGSKASKMAAPRLLAQQGTDPFLRESIERAEELLEQVRAEREGEKPSDFAEDCRARLDVVYGDHAKALQAWDGLLARQDVFKPPIRRQIIWTTLRRRGGEWKQLESKELDRCLRLLNDNFVEGPNDDQSLRLWLRAVRYSSNPPSLESIVERVGYWKANTNSLDAAFYLYVLHTLAALEGSTLARSDAERAMEECRVLASRRRNRSISFEWLGEGKGIARLVHHSQLGDRSSGFWDGRDLLDRVEGRIASIEAPQKGKIELFNGQTAFFVPAIGDFHAGRDENRRIGCFLGFSYDGLRAWEVGALDA